jgi:hypothetical protein
MLSGLGNPEACFLSGIKAFFIEYRGYNDLRRAAEGVQLGTMQRPVYMPSCSAETIGATADDTAKGYMRRVVGGCGVEKG